MERLPVQSSTIASIGYELDSSILEVEFLNASLYQYFGVPESLFNDLMYSPSKGKFLDMYIKKAGYSYTRVS